MLCARHACLAEKQHAKPWRGSGCIHSGLTGRHWPKLSVEFCSSHFWLWQHAAPVEALPLVAAHPNRSSAMHCRPEQQEEGQSGEQPLGALNSAGGQVSMLHTH